MKMSAIFLMLLVLVAGFGACSRQTAIEEEKEVSNQVNEDLDPNVQQTIDDTFLADDDYVEIGEMI